MICQGRIELIQQIAVGRVDFYPIEARLSGPPGGLAKCLSRLLDLPDRHFCRQFFLLLGVTEGTGANRRLPRYLGRGSGAGMAQLGKDFHPFLVHAVGQTPPTGDGCILCHGGLAGMGFALLVDIAVFSDDEADLAVPGTLLVIGADRVGDAAGFIGFGGGHGRHHQAFFQGQPMDGNRFKQTRHR